MTKRERSSRADHLSLERSPDVLLDGLLEGGPLPHDAPAWWLPVTEVLTALTSGPGRGELSGETRALAEFRARPRPVPRPGPARRRGLGFVTWRRGSRPAVAAAAGAVLTGGLLAVAYAGDLPAAAQRLAHDTIDAPAAVRPGAAVPDPARPSRTRPARRGRLARQPRLAGPVPRPVTGRPSRTAGCPAVPRPVPRTTAAGRPVPRHGRRAAHLAASGRAALAGPPAHARAAQARAAQARAAQARAAPARAAPAVRPCLPHPAAVTLGEHRPFAGGTQSPSP